MSTINYFLTDFPNQKPKVHQLDFIGAFIQANVKQRVFVSWSADMENTSHNIPTILEEH